MNQSAHPENKNCDRSYWRTWQQSKAGDRIAEDLFLNSAHNKMLDYPHTVSEKQVNYMAMAIAPDSVKNLWSSFIVRNSIGFWQLPEYTTEKWYIISASFGAPSAAEMEETIAKTIVQLEEFRSREKTESSFYHRSKLAKYSTNSYIGQD